METAPMQHTSGTGDVRVAVKSQRTLRRTAHDTGRALMASSVKNKTTREYADVDEEVK